MLLISSLRNEVDLGKGLGRKPFPKETEEERVQKAEPSLKKESPNLEICLLFITLISKNLAGLSVQTVMN